METGKVVYFGPKGYGWIRLANSRQAVFVHRRDVLGGLILEEGDLVEFSIIEAPRGPKATQVKIIVPVEDASVKGGAR